LTTRNDKEKEFVMKKKTNGGRRDFLVKSVAGIAGIAMAPSLLNEGARAEGETPKEKDYKIIKRKLGKTGLELPVVSMGVMNADNPDLVRAALDAGITHLDTAHRYQRGRNEEMVGEVLKDYPRESVIVATKVPPSSIDRKTGLFTEGATPEPFFEMFETSLERLKMDYVDILYLHSVVKRGAVLYEPYLEAMQKLKQQGKIRFAAVSTHKNEPEVIRAAVESGVYEIVLTAYNFRQPHLKEMDAAIEEASRAGLGIIAMKTQAGVYWDDEREHPINMKAALKWALKNKNVHTSIPGFTTFDQLELDMSVMEDLALSPAEELDLKEDDKMGLYCSQCGKCVSQCKKDLEIPTMMRSHMYAYGYRNLAAAKETFESAGVTELPCADCGECSVNCTMGFDVKGKLGAIARIRSVPDDFIA
jgi:predicted aldo/keto reductase-like oxidoreductase